MRTLLQIECSNKTQNRLHKIKCKVRRTIRTICTKFR